MWASWMKGSHLQTGRVGRTLRHRSLRACSPALGSPRLTRHRCLTAVVPGHPDGPRFAASPPGDCAGPTAGGRVAILS